MVIYKTKPYKHQKDFLEKHQFAGREYYALLPEMGTGKTKIIIDDVANLWLEGKCHSLLVFAPNNVHYNWLREIKIHMLDEVHYQMAAWTANGKKADKIEIEKLYKVDGNFINRKITLNDLRPSLRILTMNWESLQNKKGVEAAERFLLSSKDLMIVCDESDSAKNPRAKRTKNLMKLGKHKNCIYRRIMTGTPINNSPEDAFSQYNFLHKSILNISSFWAFKSEFCELLSPDDPVMFAIRQKTNRIPQVVAKDSNGKPKYKNLDKLSALIAPHSFRILKKDCLDLPDKVYKTIYFDLTKQQKAIYSRMEDECRMIFENEETPVSKLTAIGKLSQITSGYYLHPDAKGPVRIEGPTPKLDLLMGRVRSIVDSGNKVIIWARYRVEIADIVARLKGEKIKCVELHGGIKQKDRMDAIDAFEHEDIPVFVGNQQAGGTGITLVAASYVIYFSNSFSLRNRLQSEDRAHRIGQTKKVTYINIAAKNTVDEIVIDSLLNKKDVAETIIDKGLEMFR